MADIVVAQDLGPVLSAINGVNGNLRVVVDQIEAVGTRVDAVAQEQANTQQRIQQLCEEFLWDYVDKDEWTNVVSTAKQDLTLVRQELEKQFGHPSRSCGN